MVHNSTDMPSALHSFPPIIVKYAQLEYIFVCVNISHTHKQGSVKTAFLLHFMVSNYGKISVEVEEGEKGVAYIG